MRRPQRSGALKKIVKVLRKSPGLYGQAVVKLECGHIVKSNSANRARCEQCR